VKSDGLGGGLFAIAFILAFLLTVIFCLGWAFDARVEWPMLGRIWIVMGGVMVVGGLIAWAEGRRDP